jgi:phenylalanine-4-hydroxylase
MGYRYQNKLDEENERCYLASLSPIKRFFYKISHWMVMLIGGLIAFYSFIGWLLIQLF